MIVTEKMAREAAETLGFGVEVLDNGLTEVGVQAQYRNMVRSAHPDAGGTMEQFVAVDRAKHVLLNWLAKQSAKPAPVHQKQPCEECGGSGTVFTTGPRPGSRLRRQCVRCHGSGDADYDVR